MLAIIKVVIVYYCTSLDVLFVDKSNFLITFKTLDIKQHISDFSNIDFTLIGISVKIM